MVRDNMSLKCVPVNMSLKCVPVNMSLKCVPVNMAERRKVEREKVKEKWSGVKG